MEDALRSVVLLGVGDDEVEDDLVLYIPIKRDTALPVPVTADEAALTASEAAEGGGPPSLSVEGVVLFEEDDEM